MDINLGKVNLTYEQMERSHSLKTENIRGFSLKNGELVVVCIQDLSNSEKSKLISDLEKLSKDLIPRKDEDKIKDKQDKDITLDDLIKLLRHEGIM